MAAVTWEDGHHVAESDALRIVFDGTSGGIRTVANLHTDHVLVEDQDAPVPWKLTAPRTNMRLLPRGSMRPATYSFDTIEPDTFAATNDADTAKLVWTTTRGGITVEATSKVATTVRPSSGRVWTSRAITRVDASGSSALGNVADDNRIATKADLPPRTAVLIEIGNG